jgi:hypothetical protein
MTQRTCQRCANPIAESQKDSVVFCSRECALRDIYDPPIAWELRTIDKHGQPLTIAFSSYLNAEGGKRLVRQLGSRAEVTIRPVYRDRNPDEVS